MKKIFSNPTAVLVLLPFLFFTFSCSKDITYVDVLAGKTIPIGSISDGGQTLITSNEVSANNATFKMTFDYAGNVQIQFIHQYRSRNWFNPLKSELDSSQTINGTYFFDNKKNKYTFSFWDDSLFLVKADHRSISFHSFNDTYTFYNDGQQNGGPLPTSGTGYSVSRLNFRFIADNKIGNEIDF